MNLICIRKRNNTNSLYEQKFNKFPISFIYFYLVSIRTFTNMPIPSAKINYDQLKIYQSHLEQLFGYQHVNIHNLANQVCQSISQFSIIVCYNIMCTFWPTRFHFHPPSLSLCQNFGDNRLKHVCKQNHNTVRN